MNYPWRISVQLEKSPWKLLSIWALGKQTEVAYSCSDIQLISSSLFMLAGLEVCLADSPAPHQKPSFAIKGNAHRCRSLQVTRTDEGPY